MKILLTGGTGYLGSKLLASFLSQGHNVLCTKLPSSSMKFLENTKETIKFVDTSDPKWENVIIAFEPEIVIHTAGRYERGSATFRDIYVANYEFPLKILQICLKTRTRRWINTCTALPRNLNIYSLFKNQFSEWGKFYAQRNHIVFSNLLLEHFYGINAPESHFITWVVNKLKLGENIELTEGTQRRDFVYVNDLVQIYDSMLLLDSLGYCDIPVGTGETPTIREVVEYIHKSLNSSSELQFGKIQMRVNEFNSKCDLTILKSMGLSCKTKWQDGIKAILEES